MTGRQPWAQSCGIRLLKRIPVKKRLPIIPRKLAVDDGEAGAVGFDWPVLVVNLGLGLGVIGIEILP